MDHGDDTSRAGSPPREAGGEPESCFGEPEESVSQSAESSSPEGSPLDRPRKQACRHSLHEEAVKVAVLNLQVACRIPVGTQSKKARSVEDVVVDGFLKVAVKFPDAFDPWLSPKAQGLINSTSEALAATASTAEGQESRPRSSTLPRTKNRGFKMPALPRNKPVPDRVAGAIHAAFVGEPGHPRPPVFPSTLAVRFNQVCGKGEQGGQPSDLTTTLVSPGQLVRVSYNQAVDGDKHKAKPSPAAQQEGLAIVVSAPLYGGGPKAFRF